MTLPVRALKTNNRRRASFRTKTAISSATGDHEMERRPLNMSVSSFS